MDWSKSPYIEVKQKENQTGLLVSCMASLKTTTYNLGGGGTIKT